MNGRFFHWVGVGLVGLGMTAQADVTLLGINLPGPSVLDGDFDQIRAGWRAPQPSPYWVTNVIKGNGRVGCALGQMMNGGATTATLESVVLDHTEIKALKTGDMLAWRFASNTEYPSDGRVSFSLLFGTEQRTLADRINVPNGPDRPGVYEGVYTVTAADAQLGMPKAQFTLEATHGVKVYIDWVDLKVLRDETAGPADVKAVAVNTGVNLTWQGNENEVYSVFRSDEPRKNFKKVADSVKGNYWTDPSIINGKTYFYAVKRTGGKEMSASPVVSARKIDADAPDAPENLTATGEDWIIKLNWATLNKDVESYTILRGDAAGKHMTRIASGIIKTSFEDMLPIKGVENSYRVEAIDYSGNRSVASKITTAKVQAVHGASFSDLILPMPIHKQLRSDLWGAEGVIPRDPDNGVEDPAWTYWGGKVIKDACDGKYHICITRWPEGDRRGHWAWPESTVAHMVSDTPTGPFVEKRATAYDYHDGLGHNPNIIVLNDGTYAMYSLINWKPTILTAHTMNGPWTLKGELLINTPKNYTNAYRLERNLSGVQQEDGHFLFVTKAGAMMRSTTGILGPYDVVTGVIGENKTIPEKYRHSNYEDPTMWYDGLQYHMIINAFLDYRAVYFRSPDGINWKYEDGLAYTPTCTSYEDGTRTFWYKVERPNVLQDKYGRATHLSLAVIDVKKDDDYGNDAHSAKHVIIPLVVPKRITMRNSTPVTNETSKIAVFVHSEDGFNAATELDLKSLRIGASEEVNFGRGAKAYKIEPSNGGAMVFFYGAGNGMTDKNFVCKMIGQTHEGTLIVGYSKRVAK